jgi:hypothetical protein
MSMLRFDTVNRGAHRRARGRAFPRVLCLALAAWVIVHAGEVRAEDNTAVAARLAHLARLMRDADFRVRTQAAFSLGRLGAVEGVEVLGRGLQDQHPAVRAAAAVSLGRLGHQSALPILRAHNDTSDAVRSQVARSISVLEASPAPAAAVASQPAAAAKTLDAIDWTRAHHYLELADVVNVSKTTRPDLEKLVESIAWREMKRLNGYVVSEARERPLEIAAFLKRHRVDGYSINISLGRLVRIMAPNKVRVSASVMLAVISYPDQVYRMTVNGDGSVTIGRGAFAENQVPALQENALTGAIQAAIRELDKTLVEQTPRRRPRRARAE